MASSKSLKLCSSLLPFELVEEILYRIPLGSLVRFKSICKQWYALFNDKRFIYKHLDLSRKLFIQIHRHTKTVQLFNLETQAPSCLQGPPNIHRMIHCDGLLLCHCTERDTCYSKLAVWNPVLSRLNWITPSKKYKLFGVVYGFGYDNNVSRENYKILRFNVEENSDIEIYECKSKLWRSIDAALDSCVELWYLEDQGLSMNGNMYWIVHRKKDNSETEILVQSFDFSIETFKDIGYGVPFETGYSKTLVLSSFGEDRLSLLHQHIRVEIEVWITNKVTDEVVSWSKYFHVTRPDLPILHDINHFIFPAYFIDHKTNNIMVLLGRELRVQKIFIYVVNVYEISDGDIKIQGVQEQGIRCWGGLHNYCPCFKYR